MSSNFLRSLNNVKVVQSIANQVRPYENICNAITVTIILDRGTFQWFTSSLFIQHEGDKNNVLMK
jgi:hypothetical protein